MRIFQVFCGMCHWDASRKHPTIEDTVGKYAGDVLFVEAPDYVREGWGYDYFAEGDDRFSPPEPPEGFLYDRKTGTFYPENGEPVVVSDPQADVDAMMIDHEIRMALFELGVNR